ncbi:IclR family transcriptional regulator [Ornithinimicrobium tianjinense]|uniref:Transcriptional regulator, IclR family n=1 Tax=Ornithinimicrobium tianjinense TaxID=1195761 RepID=A0A917BVJ7_9MICO|nr:helix-turn-helix domain-containing protein [Ornithinimicrobium tianjinense]GGF58441.1 hypothetical protein GCM10011366_27830 [Ornithinimicrobium tianjinense]
MATNDPGRGGLGTVRNAVQLLELLAEGPAYHQLTDLAERSSMSIPTVHRLLRSLVLADLAVQDPATSRYGLGPELSRLSHHYLARLPLLGALSPYLSQVRDQVGATVHVEVLVRGEVVYVDRVDSVASSPFRESHRVLPALTTAGGRLLAARGDEEAWGLACARGGDADDASRRAWATADWLAHRPADLTLPAEVAVPVLDAAGAAVGALAAELPGTDPATPEGEARAAEVAAYLERAARAAGRTLGHG